MKKTKKVLSYLLVAVILVTAIPIMSTNASAASSIKTQAEAVAWLKAQGGATYNLDTSTSGTQCVEFVKAYVNWLMTGNAWTDTWHRGTGNGIDVWKNSLWKELGWQVYENTLSFMPQPGDIFSSGTSGYGHTGVVISSDLYTATVADANVDSPYNGTPVKVHTINWRSASSNSAYGATHYIRPNFASPHTHNYNTYVYFWKSHPHYKCYKCSCGEVKENRNEPTFLADCDECNPSVDLGASFYASIVHSESGKIVTPNDSRNVVIQSSTGNSNQYWKFERQSDLSYKIINSASGLCLDLLNSNPANNTNIQVHEDNGCDAQRWYIKKNGGGYALVPKCARSSALDLPGNISNDGTNIELYQWYGNSNQRYRIENEKEHKFGSWTTTKEASCSEAGSKTRTCSICGNKETQTIAATGHKYTEKVVDPTTTEKGYTLHTCTVCGNSYKDNYTDPVKPVDPNAPQIVVDSKSASPESKVTVNVSIKNNPGIWGMDLAVNYDKSVLTLDNVTNGVVFSSSEWTLGNIKGDKYNLSYEASGFDNVKTNGIIATLEFTVNPNAKVGSSINITVNYNPGDIINSSSDNINPDVVSGEIKILNFIYGDVNSDGVVNKKDSLLLKRYLADNTVEIDKKAADVNADNSVNKKDSLRLKQYLAGWDVKLG